MKMEKRLVFDNIAKEAHANAVEHGFWDVRMSNEHYLMLVISEVAEAVRIQYGGSMKPGNAAELLAKPNIDGGLIGGAALKAADFTGIIAAASKK